MEALRPLASLILPGKCFDSILLDLNVEDVECIKVAISKCLGYGMILGSSLVKLPQILKILSAKSAAGLSIPAVAMDLAGVTATTAYSFHQAFPFSAYGEGILLMLETSIILMLALHYSKRTSRAMTFAILYLLACFVLSGKVVPSALLWWGQVLAAPTAITGKMWQALDNLRAGHTGQLSMITMLMLLLGCIARIFTSITETGDTVLIMSYVLATFANSILVCQIVWFWGATEKANKAAAGKKTN